MLHTPELAQLVDWAKSSTPKDALFQFADFGERQSRENYLRVRFEDLCNASLATTTRILNFLEAPIDPEAIARAEIAPPESLGRWRNYSLPIISKLERMGAPGLRRFGYLEQ